jgi:hypothetical protein
MSKFSFERDLDKVLWGKTIWLNLMRAFSAGIVVTLVILLFGVKITEGGLPLFAIPLIAPLAYIFIIPALILFFQLNRIIIGSNHPLTLLISIFYSLSFGVLMALGDPLVFLLHKVNPSLVPQQKYNFMNFVWCIFVLDPKKTNTNT